MAGLRIPVASVLIAVLSRSHIVSAKAAADSDDQQSTIQSLIAQGPVVKPSKSLRAAEAGGRPNPAAHVWLAFAIFVPVLVSLEHVFLADRRRTEVSITSASWQCCFWVLAGLLFNLFVWRSLGSEEAISWFSGYVLEYMLSIDNLFCFHLIFTSYKTPKDQTHRALFWGIGGAVVLRLVLFALGASMFNFTFVVHWVFGLILLWSGFKVITMEDSEPDPTHNWLVKLVTKVLPVEESYATGAPFFVQTCDSWSAEALEMQRLQENTYLTVRPTAITREGGAVREGVRGDCRAGIISATASAGEAALHSGSPVASDDHRPGQDCGGDAAAAAGSSSHRDSKCGVTWKATLLFLVVLTLGAVDLIFALDSVTAKVSMVSQFEDDIDLAINFTSSALPMLTLRSLYVLLASLVHVFRLLKYGVGLILVLIGLRLMASNIVDVSEASFCALMLSVFLTSILASMCIPAERQEIASLTSAGGGGALGGEDCGTAGVLSAAAREIREGFAPDLPHLNA